MEASRKIERVDSQEIRMHPELKLYVIGALRTVQQAANAGKGTNMEYQFAVIFHEAVQQCAEALRIMEAS